MTGISAFAVTTLCTILVLGQDYVTFKDRTSQDLFVASRAAVARGEGSVKNLRSLVLKGRARVAQDGGAATDSTVVIKVLMPDTYLRIDTVGRTMKATGFDGSHLLTSIVEDGGVSAPPASMSEALLRGERARFTRLLLGTAAALSPALRLNGRTAPGLGSMERPGGTGVTGDVYESANEQRLIELSGPDGFYARYVVDAAKVPQRLEFRAAKDEIWTMTFSDRRTVGGLLLPYRIVTNGRGIVREDLRFDEILVNPELAKGDFTVPPR